MTDKKIHFIIYILNKSDLANSELVYAMSKIDDSKFLELMIVFNNDSFFNVISHGYIQDVLKDHKQLNHFSIERVAKKLSKKDTNFVKRLFEQELISLALFYENYLIFNLSLTTENIEFFKSDKNPKIYRYKKNVILNEKVYSIKDLFLNGDQSKTKYIEGEYRIEKIILSP